MPKALTVAFAATFVLALPAVANEALRDSIEAADFDRLQALIERGTDIDARDIDGATALHWAVYHDEHEAVQLLIDAGADATLASRYGVTPLYLAAVNGNAEVISLLLGAGADPEGIGPYGETMLMTAARTGVPAAVEALIEAGAAIDTREPEFDQTALMLAAREANAAVLQLLIDRGADVDARTRVGETPDFVPPCKGTGCGSEGVGINRGGLPDRGRRDPALGGMTPLLYASRDGLAEIAALLVDAGADLELAEANGIRPLLMSLLNGHLDVARVLVDAGADRNADDYWGRTPLWAAVEHRNLDMNNRDQDDPQHNGIDREPYYDFIADLLTRGVDVNARTREVPPQRRFIYSLGDVSWVDFTGQTAFLRAALSGDVEIMRLLLDHGADPNIATFAGTTPLMAAAGVNWVVAQTYTVSPEASLEAVKLTLELGNDINATNSMGLSALLGAVNRGANHIVRYLAEQGADLYVVDVEGRDAIRWAEGVFLAAVGAERKPETIALLEELMATDSRTGVRAGSEPDE
ncbi:MAG: ankyrin repeat domain-containing protein [Gammaproteobacteria bacterium]|nr:ankyrin repeat domain-containing protein [Gammaproteobacteria bacterium]